ncbi:hypothetical protein IU474_19765 [Nocardia otitidiscaviarum]|uniref:hypothetical protein n=1 Tax=Nocardia otitidiscaviarum TaxID=1823 RepID=UPI00189486F8|nr:hypothetical protein [Nocardia otitidiscaviarum]MBF6239287.1 hypothetical protein [Nocardia otitidiscaviarum]
MDMALEWDRHPGTGLRLANELAGAAGLFQLEDVALDQPSDLLGTIAARSDGRLLGWAELRAAGPRDAWVQVIDADRLVRSIRLGHTDDTPATPDETEVFATLIASAAGHAQGAGYRVLRWEGSDTGPEGQAAALLEADVIGEVARLWTAELGSWEPPEGAGAIAADQWILHAEAESTEPPGNLFIVALLGEGATDPIATITATIIDDIAYINTGEQISYADVDSDRLAGLVVALLAEIQDRFPTVAMLRVFEFDDATVRAALEHAGLDLAAHFRDYELVLVED